MDPSGSSSNSSGSNNGNGNRNNNNNKQPRRNDGSSPSSSSSSSSSRATPAAIPGFVYDPVRKRYFKQDDHHGPNNNFTVPVGRILARHRANTSQPPTTWVYPGLTEHSSTGSLLRQLESAPLGATERKRACAAFHHRQLRVLRDDASIGQGKVAEAFQMGDGVTLFEAVSGPTFLSEKPQIIFAASRDERINRTDLAVELRITNGEWRKDVLTLVDRHRIRMERSSLSQLNAGDTLEVRAVHSLAPQTTFISCARFKPGELLNPRGFFIMESPDGLRTFPFPRAQTLTAANYKHGLIATTSGSPPLIMFLNIEDLSKLKGAGLPDVRTVITSLDLHPEEKGLLFGGTMRSQVFRTDFRNADRPTVLLDKDAWGSTGITGHCQVTTVKALERPNWLITAVAALPQEAPKISLWDCRNTHSPFTTFADSRLLPFSREKLEISLSEDNTLAVASDSSGLTRFWDVNSGTLVGSIPACSVPQFGATDTGLAAPLAFYHAEGKRKALVMVKRGISPAVIVHNLNAVHDVEE